jgi:excisionase family DNA binding protein
MGTALITPEHPAELRRRAFSVAETAVILGVSAVSVRRLIVRGLLQPNRTLRHIRISEAEIDRYLAN